VAFFSHEHNERVVNLNNAQGLNNNNNKIINNRIIKKKKSNNPNMLFGRVSKLGVY